LTLGLALGRAELPARNFVYESEREFTATGDFDGDGRTDLVIVQKDSGKMRLGYQLDKGVWAWVNWRPAGTRFLGGMTVGRLLSTTNDALAFASADANVVTVVDVSNPKSSVPAALLPLSALGPNCLIAVDVGGAGNTPLHDLVVGSIYNSDPFPNLELLLRASAGKFSKLSEGPLPGPAVRANRVSLQAGQPERCVAMLINGEGEDSLRVADFSSGKAQVALTIPHLPAGADYAVGRFGGSALSQFVVYKAGQSNLLVRPIAETGGTWQAGAGASFPLAEPIKQVLVIPRAKDQQLLVVFGTGLTAGVFDFDGTGAPVLAQALHAPTNEVIFAAAVMDNGLIFFTDQPVAKAPSRYTSYTFDGQHYVPGVFGGLVSLADTDDVTVPEIHQRILAKSTVSREAEMTPYTNNVPGTEVPYSMIPIPGGQFVMGSPAGEKDRNADEGPQHKVQLSPFWIGQFEITWNEYQLFMYPDDEKRLRTEHPSDPDFDKVSDAVSRPSRPYVEMSFGMGKERFPAIAMTQHAASKYCHWLSAKTGHFYRLPTEAEWEYACRAGTTGAYYFGADAGKLADHGWYFENSNSKYQKVGLKQPNAWGLYDIAGNVVEWCLDQYSPDFYKVCAEQGTVTDPWNRATAPYPHSARGGSWDDDAPALRSAARPHSERTWKMTDPQLPKSIWYLSDSRLVGFRLVRPLKVPSPEQMVKYWNSGVERD
jgi:formylglycine-generating enzyme required for sulfatase activity